MASKYSSGKWSISQCDRCGFRYKLKQLKQLVIKTKNVNILVCPTCWEKDHPQLQLGMYPVSDPQAVRNPRPEIGYYQSGTGGDGGSRITQWGWNPVGLDNPLQLPNIQNNLIAISEVGSVTIAAT